MHCLPGRENVASRAIAAVGMLDRNRSCACISVIPGSTPGCACAFVGGNNGDQRRGTFNHGDGLLAQIRFGTYNGRDGKIGNVNADKHG